MTESPWSVSVMGAAENDRLVCTSTASAAGADWAGTGGAALEGRNDDTQVGLVISMPSEV